jgi:hypothetical protein
VRKTLPRVGVTITTERATVNSHSYAIPGGHVRPDAATTTRAVLPDPFRRGWNRSQKRRGRSFQLSTTGEKLERKRGRAIPK